MEFAHRCELAADYLNRAARTWNRGRTDDARRLQEHGEMLANETRQRSAGESACDAILAEMDRM